MRIHWTDVLSSNKPTLSKGDMGRVSEHVYYLVYGTAGDLIGVHRAGEILV